MLNFTPAPVTRVSDLLKLRSYFLSQLSQRYVWLIKLSVIEWSTLSAQEKEITYCDAQVFSHLVFTFKVTEPSPYGTHRSNGVLGSSKVIRNLSTVVSDE